MLTSFLVEFRPFGVGYARRRVWPVQVVTIHLTNRFGPQVLLVCNFALPIVTKNDVQINCRYIVESLKKIAGCCPPELSNPEEAVHRLEWVVSEFAYGELKSLRVSVGAIG